MSSLAKGRTGLDSFFRNGPQAGFSVPIMLNNVYCLSGALELTCCPDLLTELEWSHCEIAVFEQTVSERDC